MSHETENKTCVGKGTGSALYPNWAKSRTKVNLVELSENRSRNLPRSTPKPSKVHPKKIQKLQKTIQNRGREGIAVATSFSTHVWPPLARSRALGPRPATQVTRPWPLKELPKSMKIRVLLGILVCQCFLTSSSQSIPCKHESFELPS